MRKVAVVLFLLTMFAGAVVVKASDGDKKELAVTNKMCPVMKAKVSEKYRTEYKGQYVYFCCQGCVGMFEKDPEKYIATLSIEDQEAIKPNEVCPMTKEPIADHTRFVEYEGRKVYFCCDGCVEMFKKQMAEKSAEVKSN